MFTNNGFNRREQIVQQMKVSHLCYNISKSCARTQECARTVALAVFGPQDKPRLLRTLNDTFRLCKWAVISETTKKHCVYKNQLQFLVRTLKGKAIGINQPQRRSIIESTAFSYQGSSKTWYNTGPENSSAVIWNCKRSELTRCQDDHDFPRKSTTESSGIWRWTHLQMFLETFCHSRFLLHCRRSCHLRESNGKIN